MLAQGFIMSISPLQFLRQVKQEVKKVTWPTKKEVMPSCVMVVTLVAVATAFFFAVDLLLSWGVDKILMLG
jgi:preprotein translocase subunit SecE